MKNIIRKIESILLIIAMISFTLVLILEISTLNKVIYGAKIGNENVGGMSRSELKHFIEYKIKNNKEVTLLTSKEKLIIPLNELGISINVNESINLIFNIGRDKNIFYGIKTQVQSFFKGNRVKLAINLDESIFNDYIKKNISYENNPAENAKFIYGEDISIEKEKTGAVINNESLKSEIIKNIASLKKNDVQVILKIENADISEKALLEKKDFIESILNNAPYVISQNKIQSWEIDKDLIKELIQPIKIDANVLISLDPKKLEEFLIQILPSINRKPQNAILTVKNNKVTEFKLSKNGTKLNIEESIKNIEFSILQKEKNITLNIDDILPEIRTETIENLGITSLLGKGESDFTGSIPSRVHNVKLGAEKINGTLIKPSEEFSFIEKLGEISPKEGYKAAYVIKKGSTILEYGGGLCQVSTTTFRAAMYAGLKITERFPHSYPVQYYNPQGFDAAIYGPHPDLRFVNNTPNYILIQSKVIGNKLYFEIYGTSDDRKVEIIGPVEYDKKPDGSLKTRLTRKVYDKDNNIIEDRTFWSTYKSQNLYPVKNNPLE